MPACPTRSLPVDLAQLADDVVARPPRRLVDHHQPVAHDVNLPFGRPVPTDEHLRTKQDLQRGEDLGDDRLGGFVAREAGREAVAAAALRLGDQPHVDACRASAGSRATVPSGASFSTHAHLGLARAPHDVDQAFDLFERHAVAREIVLRDLRPHELLARGRAARATSTSASSCRYAKRCSSNSVRDSSGIGTSNAASSRASSNTAAVVDSYWNRPVSHTSAAYRQTAASRVSGRSQLVRSAGARARRSRPRRDR